MSLREGHDEPYKVTTRNATYRGYAPSMDLSPSPALSARRVSRVVQLVLQKYFAVPVGQIGKSCPALF
jgi:hypothetical protein